MRGLVLAIAALVIAPSCTTGLSLSIAAPVAEPAESEVATDVAGAVESMPSSSAPAPSSTTTAPTLSTATTTTTTATEAPGPLTLGFVGDVHMIGEMSQNHPLTLVAPILAGPDLTFANLETVVGEVDEVGSPPIDKKFVFRSPPITLDILEAAGVDVLGMANNHSWDYGPAGLEATSARVAASGLTGVGVGTTVDEAYAPAFIDVGEQRVGVVSLTRVPCDWSTDRRADRPGVAWACDRFDLGGINSIATAAAGADVTVVMVHAGVEVTDCPGPKLRQVIETWISFGADVVSISHPHVLQGVEIIDGAAVLWSTGNFSFTNRGGRTGRSALFEVTVEPGADPRIRLVPTVLPGGQARPADADDAAAVFAEVSDRSRGGVIGDDGFWRPDPSPSRCD